MRAVLDRIAPRYAPIRTALGPGFYAYTAGGVVLLLANVTERTFLREAKRRLGARPVRRDPPPAFARRVRSACERGDGSAVDWDTIAPFQRRVLRATSRIPSGAARPYAWVAARIGSPRAVRAVGTALARNPVPLLVPCHRVIRSDGSLGNYGGGGTAAKRRLLDRESARIA